MKAFEVINKENCSEDIWGEKDCPTVTIVVHEPPYTDDEILRKIRATTNECKFFTNNTN